MCGVSYALPFRAIFIIICLVWGVVPVFLYWVWKVFLHVLYLHLGVFVVGCWPIFTMFSLPQYMHFRGTFIILIV